MFNKIDIRKNPYYMANAVGQGAAGAGQVAGSIAGAFQDANINTGVAPGTQEYNLGQDVARIGSFDPSQVGKGMIGQTALQGAGAGLAAGGVPGAIIGGAVGAAAGAFGKVFARNRAENRAEDAQANLAKAQASFNQSNIARQQQFLAQQQYEDQLRRNNIYNLPFNLV